MPHCGSRFRSRIGNDRQKTGCGGLELPQVAPAIRFPMGEIFIYSQNNSQNITATWEVKDHDPL